jgi:hypothetical protein
MAKYNHAFTVGFSVLSENTNALDVDADMIRTALRRLVDTYTDDELMENAGAPFDTYEMEDDV